MDVEHENLNNNQSKPQHGGARIGAGRPKGRLSQRHLEKKEALAHFIKRVSKNVDRLFNAQLSLAKGMMFMYKAEKTAFGIDHILIKNPEEIKAALDLGKEMPDGSLQMSDGTKYYYFTSKAPDNKAIDSLLNRAFGKPKETMELIDDKPKRIVMEVVDTRKNESDERIPEEQGSDSTELENIS